MPRSPSGSWTSRCGRVALTCADCFDFLPTVATASIDAVVTDPPYASTDCRWDRPFDLAGWWGEINRVTRETSIVASFAAQPFATNLINSARGQFRYELVWHKSRPVGFLNANRQPLRAHELILIFCRRPGQSVYRPQKTAGKPYRSLGSTGKAEVYRRHKRQATVNHGDRHPRSVLSIDEPGRGGWHPTQKPVPLCEWLIRSYTDADQLVCDPFAGSASTAIACLRTGRRFVGCERDPAIFARAVERLRLEEKLATQSR